MYLEEGDEDAAELIGSPGSPLALLLFYGKQNILC
jgi:hypothetical protein